MINLVTLNVNGIGDKNKRFDVFQTLRNENFDIIALQETHCDSEETAEIWTEEWGGKSIWSKYRSDRAGVAFLFNPKIDLEILDKKIDEYGRILSLIVETEKSKLQLVNVYGLNQWNMQQTENFFRDVDEFIQPHIQPIIFGDFNMVIDLENDRSGGNPSKRHTYGEEALTEIIESYDLFDVWRSFNPRRNRYTWRTKNNRIKSRLDRIYTPQAMKPNISSCYITYFPFSDHDVCGMKMSLPGSPPHGPGYWCLNTQFLAHEEYQDRIRTFWTEWQGSKWEFEDIRLWWDCFKVYVKSISIQYAKEIHMIRKNRKYDLLDELEIERAKTISDPDKLAEIEFSLQEIERETNEKIFIHTHTSDRDIREKPNKYFYRLLRVRQNDATMESLLTENGKIVTTQEGMMEEARNYYQKLYKKKEDVSIEDQNFFLNKIDKFLTERQKADLDSEIELKELENALEATKKTKRPGSDGLPYEFYESFWDILGKEFLKVVRFSLNEAKCLPYSQTVSLIRLSHKKGERRLLKNWRPISLLCCDYKIISKTLANRMKWILASVIADRQTCGVRGRCIAQNLIYMRDLIFFADFNKIDGYILSIDQEKAFDLMDREFLIRVLQKMNFGEKFIEWIKVIFKETIGRVLLNGYTSMTFEITRGARQGCPLSADVYISYIQPLDDALNKDKFIISVQIPGKKAPVTILYADDMNLALSDKTDIGRVIIILEKFENATGSKINQDKTQGLMLNNPRLEHPIFEQIEWKNKEGIEILGILFHTKYTDTIESNWSILTSKMTSTLNSIRYRSLSLKGKITVLNSLTLSRGWYAATITEISDTKLKQIETLALKYLWSDKKFDLVTGELKNPIARRTIYQPREKGGLSLINPKLQQQSLQLKFLKEILNPENKSSWLQLPRYWIGLDLSFMNINWHFLKNYPRFDPLSRDVECRPEFYIKLLEKFKSIYSQDIEDSDWASHTFYVKFLEMDEHFPKSYTNVWNKYNHLVDPTTLWIHVHNSVALGKHQDVHFRFLHQILPTNEFKKTRFTSRGFQNTNPMCGRCPGRKETNIHVIFECVAARSILDFAIKNLDILLRGTAYTLFNITVNVFPDGISAEIKKMAIGLWQISMRVIWLNRNQFVFKQKITNITESINTISKQFKSAILAEFQTLDRRKFTKRYCHTPRICKIHNDELVIHLEK